MKISSLKAIVTTAAIFVTFPTKADDMAYLATNGFHFGMIDLATGAFFLLGTSQFNLDAGLGVANGILYGATNGQPHLYVVNLANGSLTLVGDSSANYDTLGSTPNGLFEVGTDGNLYSINPANGASTLIGATGLGNSNTGGLSNNSNTLYYTDFGKSLHTKHGQRRGHAGWAHKRRGHCGYGSGEWNPIRRPESAEP